MGRIKRDSNVWWNSAPHDLAILLYLVPRRVLEVRLHEHCYSSRASPTWWWATSSSRAVSRRTST